ncbi:MAG: MutT/NUDIX family protein [uncultured bacterium]|nr:MAG: MutT/NUDIX family protein [uncultured bacterium]
MKAGVDYIGVSAGAVIINENGEILLTKRSQNAKNEKGKWESPGGAVEFCETREDSIKREIKEELGVEIEIIRVLHTTDEILEKDKQHWVPTTYLTKIKKGQVPQIMEPEKCDEIGWFSLKNLPSPISYVTSLDLEEYKKQLGR